MEEVWQLVPPFDEGALTTERIQCFMMELSELLAEEPITFI